MLGQRHLDRQFGLDGGQQRLAVGDQHRGGARIVLGLADQVRGNVARVRAVVGKNRDLGGTGLGVDADHAAHQPLGRSDVDVAGTGDEIDRVALAGAVGEHRDRLRAAHPVDLIHSEQGAGGEDGRMRIPAVLPLRWRGHRQRSDPGKLGRYDVHDDAGGVDGQPARNVQADPADRAPPLADGAAGNHLRHHVVPALILVHPPGARDGLLQCRSDRRTQRRQGGPHPLLRNPQPVDLDPVQPRGDLPDGLLAAHPDVLTQRADRVHGGIDVRRRPGQDRPQGPGGQVAVAQIDELEHG